MFRATFHSNKTAIASVPILILIFLLSPGCRTPAPSPSAQVGSLMWPPPPAEPRIAYEKSIKQPSDLGIKLSWWRRIGRFFVGQNKDEVAFSKPTGLCFDEQGNLCVTDTGSRKVYFFDMIRMRSKSWDRIGKIAFSSPVAVAKQGGIIYVVDSGYGGVVVFNESGELLFTIRNDLERPSGISIVDQSIWVVDAARHHIEIFDLRGKHVRTFGRRGTDAGAFNFPTHLAKARDGSNSLYVTDGMNFRVQKVDSEGNPLQIIGSIGDVSGCFSRPKGIATDSEGNLYVVDALFDNIQIFDNTGQFLMHWGENGTEPGYFWLPSGIAVDALDRIWVADSYNRRIQVFKRIGNHGES